MGGSKKGKTSKRKLSESKSSSDGNKSENTPISESKRTRSGDCYGKRNLSNEFEKTDDSAVTDLQIGESNQSAVRTTTPKRGPESFLVQLNNNAKPIKAVENKSSQETDGNENLKEKIAEIKAQKKEIKR